MSNVSRRLRPEYVARRQLSALSCQAVALGGSQASAEHHRRGTDATCLQLQLLLLLLLPLLCWSYLPGNATNAKGRDAPAARRRQSVADTAAIVAPPR